MGGGGRGATFLLFTVQFNHIYSVCVCGAGGGGVRFPLLLFGSSVF